jgi:hypothetical protein
MGVRVEHERWCEAVPPRQWDVWADEWTACTCGLEREHQLVAWTCVGLLWMLAAVFWGIVQWLS